MSGKRPTLADLSERLTPEVLKDLAYLPLTQAAAELRVSVTTLKRVCRRHGIRSWPFRRVDSICSRIKHLLDEGCDPQANNVRLLRQERDRILEETFSPEKLENRGNPEFSSSQTFQTAHTPVLPFERMHGYASNLLYDFDRHFPYVTSCASCEAAMRGSWG